MKKVVFAFIALVSFLAMASSSGCINETIPTNKTLESIVKLPLNVGNGETVQASFSFKYSGRYVVFLVLRHEGISPHDLQNFKLKGIIEITDEEGNFFYQSEFNKLAGSNNATLTLDKFEVDKKDITGTKKFKIKFTEGLDVADSFSSSIELHLKKELKHRIFY